MIKRQTSIGFELPQDTEEGEKQAYDEMRKKLLDSLKRVFRPEFINRLDSVIVFRSLSMTDIQQIVQLELDKVGVRLVEHELTLTASPDALDELAKLGYDPEMGARPLRRIIQQKVEDPLSDALLGGRFEHGDTVLVELEDGEIVLKKGEAKSENPPEAVAAA